ncbi:MAG: 2Fe-2S iron-sulfur cluster-binding protein [Bradymonadaceae bacterium]
MNVTLEVNGNERTLEVPEGTPLLWVLRDYLGLTGSKYGCGKRQCGSCTVHVEGSTRRSCVTPVEEVEGRSITTIEGLEGPEGLRSLVRRLRPDGRLVRIDDRPSWDLNDPETYRRARERAADE